MRKVAASQLRSLAGVAKQPEDFVIDVDHPAEANQRGVSR
jgi:hypothetical protein